MKLAIDGIIYEMQAAGGISRMYTEILPRLCEQDPTLAIAFYTAKPYRQPPPTHKRITYRHLMRRDLRPYRIAHRLRPVVNRQLFRLWVRHDMIWHSTYHTLPPKPVRVCSWRLIRSTCPYSRSIPILFVKNIC